MLQTTPTIYPEIPFFAEESSRPAAVIDLEKFFCNNDSLCSNIIDLETKQQIIHSLLFRIRQMSRIRRLSVTKLKA
jgi:hypothetical protein